MNSYYDTHRTYIFLHHICIGTQNVMRASIYMCAYVLFRVRSKYVMLDKNAPFVIGISHCVYRKRTNG